MSNYNTQLQSNNTDLQTVLQTLQNKVAGNIEQATPEISVDSSTGLITATAGTKSSTHQLAFQPAKTITPSTVSQVVVSSGYYTGGNITVAGDSNLVASNIKSGVSIFGVSGTLEEGGGGETVVDDVSKAIIEGTITEISDDSIEVIGNHAFAYCTTLTTANFPAAITIGGSAFWNCYNLTTANFSAATTIGNYAFYNCPSLTIVSFPNVIDISSYAFWGCETLTTASFPAATTIGGTAFRDCETLTTASFPAATTIGGTAFYACSKLTSFYLTGSSIPTLANVNAFHNTPMYRSTYTSSFGSIFVPASLVASYQAATNWATYADRITAIPIIITFTINGTEYQAEEGMTWGEWCDSEYSTPDFEPSGITQAGGVILSPLDNKQIDENHILISNGAYTIVPPNDY